MDEKLINSIIRNRRSVYPNDYTGGEISRETILELLENANRAPNHKRTEPWRFFVFMGEGLKRLAGFQSELYKERSTKEGNFNEKKYEKLQTNPLKSSCIIAIVMKRDERHFLPEVEELIATGCAMQNIWLSLSSFGLGGYMSTGGGTYDPKTKDFLGLDPDDKVLGFFYIGTYDGPVEDKPRKPVEDKITWSEN